MRAATRERERGIALVVVLWSLVLLSFIAAAAVNDARQAMDIGRAAAGVARARALADAGVERAVLALAGDGEDGAWRFDGTPRLWRFGGGSVRIAILDETGKVDLNEALPELLALLLRAAGAPADEADALADAILDYSDADDLRRLNGVEDADYAAAGRPDGAKDAPFDRVGELTQVLGMTPALYGRLEGLVTVHSGRPALNHWVAPAEVLLALPGVTEPAVARFLDLRAGPEAEDLTAPPPDIATPQAQIYLDSGRAGLAFSLRVTATTSDGFVFLREAVVRRRGAGWRTFSIEDWGQGRADEP